MSGASVKDKSKINRGGQQCPPHTCKLPLIWW